MMMMMMMMMEKEEQEEEEEEEEERRKRGKVNITHQLHAVELPTSILDVGELVQTLSSNSCVLEQLVEGVLLDIPVAHAPRALSLGNWCATLTGIRALPTSGAWACGLLTRPMLWNILQLSLEKTETKKNLGRTNTVS